MKYKYNNKWSPNKYDVKSVCDEIIENFYDNDSDYPDSCRYCRMEYISVGCRTDEELQKLPHDTNCLVLKARDIITRI